jgi:hypothetical protein
MEGMSIGQVLEAVKARASGFIMDNLPITVAIADPKQVMLGISIQRNYPLAMIERSYGIPFGCLRRDALRRISDPDELHACKWSMDVHAAVFEVDLTNELRLRGDNRHPVLALSTGLGNVLQNQRSLAYVDEQLYHVISETPDRPPPYACLVGYASPADVWQQPIGIELLLFNENGGYQWIDKADYAQHPAHAVSQGHVETSLRNIRWAVSGYPLLLAGQRVSLEATAASVGDYRHLWRLPKLQQSVIQHLAHVSELPDADRRIEFYFGVEELRSREHFVQATHGEPITLPLPISVSDEWLQTVCGVCRIREDSLARCRAFAPEQKRLLLDPEKVYQDFQATGYTPKEKVEEVQTPGDFFINRSQQTITTKLLPAAYPQHIVGLASDGCVINISIAGLSGRSGITIEDAKSLCQSIGLTDALIFDNGNDVVARLGTQGLILGHKANRRQTRLTAALHFACPLDPQIFGLHLEGFDIACSTCTVGPCISTNIDR